MPSPFPGMNPYLEQNDTWEDFHQEFLTRARALLASQVEPDYYVKIEVRLYIHELSAEERRFFGRGDAAAPAVEFVRESWLEVRDRRDRRVVTVIELLSPANKERSEHREAYLAKRNVILASPMHLVEIDLRRGGERPAIPMLPECDYYALVSRSEHRPEMSFWPISLRERLPIIQVPLSGSDPNVQLDLQAALDRAYDEAHYGNYIYAEQPHPPLSAADAEWARQFVP
jgi:hypothetical protein